MLVTFWEKTQPLYLPLSWGYALGMRLRRRAYEKGLRSRRHPGIFSVVVGNLSLGGEGKTPITLALAEFLHALGLRPVVILRGYGGRARGPLVVSEGRGPLVAPGVSGDEAWLCALRLCGVPVVVGRDRLQAADLARKRFSPGVILFDDAFQHLALRADLYLLVVSAGRDPFRERLFPAGRLREPVSVARRASAVLISRANLFPERAHELARKFAALGLPVFTVPFEAGPLIRLLGGSLRPLSERRPRRVFAFCGIGEPRGFLRLLEERGMEVCGFEAFPDHHFYGPAELEALTRRALRCRAEALITTEKDLVRIPASDSGLPVLALSLLVRLPGDLLAWLRQRLPQGE
ncbi:tetraacyldisaccharide 4'-kinase [Thermosulfurimonas sp. F29]|uniref:tetraacyldisaccharide 4'-kinase n=1 Tax=Thermosulfurimonas sp. F29 TaxID=2867247 RepID=UPI001C82AA2E|nr:tetraacyldisaccharide 4'-kinase [Thermosulfurimonas sp. F29]MBX6423934.1 tetraacyldisaccharide 4'-kinase [Thermosulfurimonas sp. F29]